MVAAPDGRLFVIQQTGEVLVIQNGRLLPTPALKVATDPIGERGLVGITVDPSFASNSYICLNYMVAGSPDHNRLSHISSLAIPPCRAARSPCSNCLDWALKATTAARSSLAPMASSTSPSARTTCRETRNRFRARLGKILQINQNATIPTDDRFYNQTMGINRAIWAMGLRNPFSTAVQPGTGLHYIDDVGKVTW